MWMKGDTECQECGQIELGEGRHFESVKYPLPKVTLKRKCYCSGGELQPQCKWLGRPMSQEPKQTIDRFFYDTPDGQGVHCGWLTVIIITVSKSSFG